MSRIATDGRAGPKRAGRCGSSEFGEVALPKEGRIFLSTELAGRREIRLALAAIVISSVIFLAAVPFARMPLGEIAAFIPIYVSVLVICDVITVVLLFNQFTVLRSRALLVLAGGYVFTAAITFSYILMFPGLFSPAGLLGAGSQSTSAMYMFWHGGFALAVIVYVLLRRMEGDGAAQSHPRPPARDPPFFSASRRSSPSSSDSPSSSPPGMPTSPRSSRATGPPSLAMPCCRASGY